MALHLECLPPSAGTLAARLFLRIAPIGFMLAGGTGLALQYGHRISVDFDFFIAPDKFPDFLLEQVRSSADSIEVIQDKRDTLDVLLDGVKCSFFAYPYPFSASELNFHGITLADPLDIAAMKLIAIAQRGARKDFIDLHACLQRHSFESIFANALRRFGRALMNPLQIGKSLIYFGDAVSDPDPVYVGEAVSWRLVEDFFRAHVREYSLHMIDAMTPR